MTNQETRMVKLLLVLATLTTFATNAFAGLNCSGYKNGSLVELKAGGSLSKANGSVLVDGREVAHFDNLEVSIVWQTFKGSNNHGDRIDGKVTSLSPRKATINRLNVPGYGISMSKVYVSCN